MIFTAWPQLSFSTGHQSVFFSVVRLAHIQCANWKVIVPAHDGKHQEDEMTRTLAVPLLLSLSGHRCLTITSMRGKADKIVST